MFVGLTALPGWLYAVPVERFLPLDTAQAVNAGFLALVAAWRVALARGVVAGTVGLAFVVAGAPGLQAGFPAAGAAIVGVAVVEAITRIRLRSDIVNAA